MLGLLLLVLGIVLTVVAGAGLEWYPSRIGGPSYWLDDHLYQPLLVPLAQSSNWLAIAGFLFLVALVLSFGGYGLAVYRAAARRRGTGLDLWLIVGAQAAICVWLAFQPYLSSQDIFSYGFYSHIFARYHDNPYVAIPRDYPFDPLFSAIFWKDQPSNYGPVWTYLSALAPAIAGSRVGLTLLVLKAIVIVPAVCGTLLLWSTLGHLRPERRVVGTLLYAWNPLLLIETGEAGHNDVVMACLLLLGLWCWSRQRRSATIAALVLAALVKYTAIMLIPLFLLAWWKRSGESPVRILGRSAALGIGLSIVAFAPLYAGPSTFAVLSFGSNALAYTNSPLELVFRETRLALGESSDLTDLPLHYDGHWIGAQSSAILWSLPYDQQGIGIALPAGTPLLVVEPQTSSWVHVYEPKLGHFGFVRANLTRPIPVPALSVAPGTTSAVLAGISQDPTAQKANLLVRVASLLVFLPWFGLVALRLTREADDDLAVARAATSVLVVYLLVVQSWFWPWYMLWVLPFAVIAPESGLAMVALGMTATTCLLNAQPSISPPAFLDWLYGSRVILIYGLPLAVGLAWTRLSSTRRSTSDGVAISWRAFSPLYAWERARVRVWTCLPPRSPDPHPFYPLTTNPLLYPLTPLSRGNLRLPEGEEDVRHAVGWINRAFALAINRWCGPRLSRNFAWIELLGSVATVARRRVLPGAFTRWRSLPWEIATHQAELLSTASRRAILARSAGICVLVAIPLLWVALSPRTDRSPSVIEWQRDFDDALRLYAAGDYQGAVDDLTPVVAAVPNDESVRRLRIAANLELERYDRTIPDLGALIRANPSNPDLYLERGVMNFRIERDDRARLDFETVIRLSPDDPVGYEWAGLTAFDRGDLAAARQNLNRALALAPQDGEIARELADVQATGSDSIDALSLYDNAINRDPSDARAYADRAALLRYLGADGLTIPDLRKVLVLSGDMQQQRWAARLLGSMTGTANQLAGRTG